MLKLDTLETSWKAKVSSAGGVLQAEVWSVWFHVTIFLNDTFHPWKPSSIFVVGGETWVDFVPFIPLHPFSFTSNPSNQAKWKTQWTQLFGGVDISTYQRVDVVVFFFAFCWVDFFSNRGIKAWQRPWDLSVQSSWDLKVRGWLEGWRILWIWPLGFLVKFESRPYTRVPKKKPNKVANRKGNLWDQLTWSWLDTSSKWQS